MPIPEQSSKQPDGEKQIDELNSNPVNNVYLPKLQNNLRSLLSNKKRVVYILLIGFLVIGALLWVGFLKNKNNKNNNTVINEPANTVSSDIDKKEEPDIKPVTFEEMKYDNDGDGIKDSDEQKNGLSTDTADSDNDGLNDGEEIFYHKTDPTNPDTDGDGYKDGEEVRGGYNPRGEGKL